MSGNLSPHHPIHAGGLVTLTGSAVVATGLRDLQSWAVSHVTAPVADTAYIHVSKSIVGGEAFLTITVIDNTFGASTTETQVSWIALGK